MAIKPLGDRILVKPLELEEKTAGGIVVPDTAKEKPQKGEVIAAGRGKVGDDGEITPMEVKKGDNILFGKYSGTEITYKGKEYMIMREEDVLAIIK